MESAIYTGTLRHRRFAPARHEFTYPVFMTLLEIAQIPHLMRVSPFSSYNRFNWASFHDADHCAGRRAPIREQLEALAAGQGIELPEGPIFLLTHLRYWGYIFNPISLFYCCDASGEVRFILAEVNSTFGERRHYWLSGATRASACKPYIHRCAKRMHVSPFMPMDLDYRFVLPPPGERLVAHMETLAGENAHFDATLKLNRQPWSAQALHRALLRFPWITAKVIAAIHWEALRLYFKKVPIYPHPEKEALG